MTCPECGGADLRHVGGVKPAELRHWCRFCGSLVFTKEGRPKRHEAPATAKRYAALRAAAQCLAGFSIMDSRDRREDDVVYSFNSHRSHRMTIGDVRAAVAALAPDDGKETPE